MAKISIKIVNFSLHFKKFENFSGVRCASPRTLPHGDLFYKPSIGGPRFPIPEKFLQALMNMIYLTKTVEQTARMIISSSNA